MKTIVKIVIGIIVFALPLIAGSLFAVESITFTYLIGQLLLWAVFQIVAVPCILVRTNFDVLFWIYTVLVVIITGIGIYVFIRKRKKSPSVSGDTVGCYDHKSHARTWLSPFLVAALVIIAYQCCKYIFGMHTDLDDTRWIAEANDALTKNRMLLYNPATGAYIGRFTGEMVKDVFSPWSMYLAVVSRWIGITPVVLAHTVFPPILLSLSYAAYYEIGRQLFTRKQERGIFLLMVSVLNLFMAGNVYTQSVFSLTRIWQGKGTVAAVMIPTIMAVILRITSILYAETRETGEASLGCRKEKRGWLLLILAGLSCCLFSGMGIAIGMLMIGIYGLYALLYSLIRLLHTRTFYSSERRWVRGGVRIAFWILSVAPSIIYGAGYLRLKG